MNATISSSILALALALPLPGAGAADIVDTAEKSSEIKSFVAAVRNAGLADSLKTNGPYTVFAPSNAAFDKLPPEKKEELSRDKKLLAQLLSHHVIPGEILVADVKPGPVKTLRGDEVMLKSDNGKISIDGGNVTLSDIKADNGVIHIIDTVVLPPQ